MSGGNIHCGSFCGDDKSGSAFEAVINILRSDISEIADHIDAQLEENEYVLISDIEAENLLPHLEKLQVKLTSEIGHENWRQDAQVEIDAGMDSIEAKWGKSRGWRLYCVNNLLGACRTSINESETICVVFS